MEQFLFNIPVSNWLSFEKEFNRLSKKASKLGFNVSANPIGQVDALISGKSVLCYEVYVQNDPVAVSSFEFIAKIKHTDLGSIISTSKKITIPESYLKNCKCDHCNVNRRRTTTYIIRNIDTGEMSQIGKTCLGDYFKIADPSNFIKYFELLDELKQASDQYGSYHHQQDELYDVAKVITAAKIAIERYGFIASGVQNSTRNEVINLYGNTSVDDEFVSKFKQWVDNINIATHHDQNLKHYVLNNNTIEQGFGYICAAVKRFISIPKVANNSKFYGEEGKKYEHEISVTKISQYEGMYGYGNRIEFVDNDGNVFVTFTTSSKIKMNDRGNASFTVKKHNKFNATEQTIIKSVKFD